tara:strand:+ start:4143 stop:4583 length:441 start_codon:yes stop_codon:yes gene_type:complete
MSWKHIIKEDIKKMADITWELDGGMLSVFLENPPDDKKDAYIENATGYVDGKFDVELRSWGVKGVGSYASKVRLRFNYVVETDTFEQDETEYDVEFDAGELDNDMPDSYNSPSFNVKDVTIYIDMKNQKDENQFEYRGDIEWQGSY